MTYRNLMAVIRKIQAKGWSFEETEKMTRNLFAEYRPEGHEYREAGTESADQRKVGEGMPGVWLVCGRKSY